MGIQKIMKLDILRKHIIQKIVKINFFKNYKQNTDKQICIDLSTNHSEYEDENTDKIVTPQTFDILNFFIDLVCKLMFDIEGYYLRANIIRCLKISLCPLNKNNRTNKIKKKNFISCWHR